MITSPRRIYSLFVNHDRHMKSFHDDPMTEVCGCSGEISVDLDRRFMTKVRKLTGLSFDEAERIADEYSSTLRSRRIRHKNPAKLEWKKKESEVRLWKSMMTSMEMAFE